MIPLNFIHLMSMKKFSSLTSIFLILLAVYWSFKSEMPTYTEGEKSTETEFSVDEAAAHVKNMSQKPHSTGFPGHAEVRNYIVEQLNLLGLKTSLQEGYTAGDWGNLSKATNILARIKGSEKGKALLLLSHYDSNPHSSLGASDAGSGVATILEGIRVFLSKNKQPKNDIIILISDSEELGLNGADLFVNQHPWASDVGLVLNFEARGSGGPSYMLIETNRGNGTLIKEFTKANPDYPVANSLVYSIYKMLPNDTDLTVFREDGDIEGFNFAFIDDHYDYHTVRDNYERMDKGSLAHQGSYLMPLLNYFSEHSVNDLKSLNDYIYFNVPFFKLVSYPFDWIFPMLLLAIIIFIALLIYGFRKKQLNAIEIGKGFLPLLITLAINVIVGFYSWSVLKWLYPQYTEILHGFTYNGHTYILAFVLFSIAVGFSVYKKYKSVQTSNLLVAPIVLWLIICTLVAVYLKGASFFIVPVYALLASFLVILNQKTPNAYLLVFLALPAIFIYTPFIKQFPVGLGLKMMVASTALTTLTFFLLLPVFSFYKRKKTLAVIGFMLFFGLMLKAHFNAGFTPENARPTSLVYLYDADTNTAKWATYDKYPSDWTKQFVHTPTEPQKLNNNTISSKYGTGFSFTSEAPLKAIAMPKIETTLDTVIDNNRFLEICITPKRNVNRLDVFTNEVNITKAEVNNVSLSTYYLENRKKRKLITHYISDNNYTELKISIPKTSTLELTIYEASNDLLSNALFTVPARPEEQIPTPFVLNDAIIISKTIKFE